MSFGDPPRRYNHYVRDKKGQTVLLHSFDGICVLQQNGTNITLYGENGGDVRAVVKLRPGEWMAAELLTVRTIDAVS